MAIPKPREVLECAVEPCHNPAEVTIYTAELGPFPSLGISLCQTCFDTFGKRLQSWPLVPVEEIRDIRAGSLAPPPLWVIPHGITSEDLDSSLASYKEMITLSPQPTITIDGHGAVHTEAKPLRYPDYLSAAIDRVSDELLDRLEEDIRRIEAHPASNPPEVEQRKPGWLPGDE